MADFTSYSALRTAILNDLSNGSVLTKSYAIGDRSRTFHSLKEVREFLEWLHMMIQAEGGDETRRNYATFGRPGDDP